MRRNLHKHRKLFQLVQQLKLLFRLVLVCHKLQHRQHNTIRLFHYHLSMLLNIHHQHHHLKCMVDKLNCKHQIIPYNPKHSSNNHLHIRSYLLNMKLMFMVIKQHLFNLLFKLQLCLIRILLHQRPSMIHIVLNLILDEYIMAIIVQHRMQRSQHQLCHNLTSLLQLVFLMG